MLSRFCRSSLFAAAALVLSCTCVSAQSVVSTFEDPDIRTHGGTLYGEAQLWYKTHGAGSVLDGWAVTQGSVDVVYHLAGTAQDGAQSIDLNGLAAGSLKRIFATRPGTRYRLSFDFSGNPINGVERELEVRWNGNPVSRFTWDPIAKANSFQLDMKWETRQVELEATGAESTIELVSTREGASGPQIDNIRFADLSVIPVSIQDAVLLTWPVPLEGALGHVLEGADRVDGPWSTVQVALLNLTADGKVAVTIPKSDAARFYRVRRPQSP